MNTVLPLNGFSLWRHRSRAYAVLWCCLVVWLPLACTKKAPAEGDEIDELEQEAPPDIDIRFDGTFRNDTEVNIDERVVTELELRDEGVQQRRNGYVVYDAPCERTQVSKRQMDFVCADGEDTTVLWPLAFTKKGELYHLAMPEMRYTRIDESEDTHKDSAD